MLVGLLELLRAAVATNVPRHNFNGRAMHAVKLPCKLRAALGRALQNHPPNLQFATSKRVASKRYFAGATVVADV
jgi:hypothetical protein